MTKILKSKYNSSGERCVDSCLHYGELRFKNEDGSPVNIEIPMDKYEEAIGDFEDRIKEGMTQSTLEPKKILKRGNFTYNQAKLIANEGKVKGIDFFGIDGSIETEHILGMSGCIEYALSIWNGDSKEDALFKSIIRSIKVFGEDFIHSLSLDNTVDVKEYIRFANNLNSTSNSLNFKLYKYKNHAIDEDFYLEDKKNYEKINNVKLTLGILGGSLAFFILGAATQYGKLINNIIAYLILNVIFIGLGAFVSAKGSKFILDKYIKNTNKEVMQMFNEEVERVSYENLLTEKEIHIILKNITKGEFSQLLLDMKGSVNKKISSVNIVNKESKFILDARKYVILPNEYEIKQALDMLVNDYKEKLEIEYNVGSID
ncbi:hypothetical protein JGS6364_25081 [[Clostridium] sordellii]|uniref:Uncharacterized protein n=1 Tax=Paraclostridium sordellii TaxID=1505 RepID=A0ABM9RR77_PARSO|nr:hypothetical protein [Paeniclostridium sordellii]MDU5020525.1 hypothetical protein [Clostridiales bacterium]AUN15161.1 hypothetical protein RSJ16_13395 [Paeniclostridium sordellii]MDU2687968.1 hypothetical protein [Paeniclostridium sordellii]MDU6114411.1 hypothetical protein [Paeniclostridium sordellii]MDU6248383.1 hypothetical protein [Paeniclostridium sordellii]